MGGLLEETLRVTFIFQRSSRWYMAKRKVAWVVGVAVLLAGGVFLAYQVYTTHLAHTTFERYYAFRGCVRLVDKTDTYGDCVVGSGQTIKIVLIDGSWYLDGDGPGIW